MIEVQEHRPGTKSYAVLRRELRSYNRTHPKLGKPLPHGWWILPGLMVGAALLILVLA